MSVGAYGLEELGIVVKGACQLVGIALVEIGAEAVVPLECFVAVECVAATHADAFEELVLLHQTAYLLEVAHRALVPVCEVGFVEGGDGYDVESLVAAVVDGGLEQAYPLGGFAHIVLAVLFGIVVAAEYLVVAVEGDVLHSREGYDAQAVVQVLLLRGAQLAVFVDEVAGLERHASRAEILLADVIGASAYIVFAGPCRVEPPEHGSLHTLVGGAEQ